MLRLTQGALLEKYVAASGPAWTMTPPGARREELFMVHSVGMY